MDLNVTQRERFLQFCADKEITCGACTNGLLKAVRLVEPPRDAAAVPRVWPDVVEAHCQHCGHILYFARDAIGI